MPFKNAGYQIWPGIYVVFMECLPRGGVDYGENCNLRYLAAAIADRSAIRFPRGHLTALFIYCLSDIKVNPQGARDFFCMQAASDPTCCYITPLTFGEKRGWWSIGWRQGDLRVTSMDIQDRVTQLPGL